MPLLANDTDGAVTRKRIETFAAKVEKVTVVAATDAATVQLAADLAGAQQVIYTMTPTAARTSGGGSPETKPKPSWESQATARCCHSCAAACLDLNQLF